MFAISVTQLNTLTVMGFCTHTNGWIHNGRKLSTNIIVCVEDGACTFRVGKKVYPLAKDDFVIVPQNTFYVPHTDTFCRFWVGHFEGTYIQQIAEDMRYVPDDRLKQHENILFLPETGKADQRLWSYIHTITEENKHVDANRRFRIHLSFLNLLDHISISPATADENTLAHAVHVYIMSHLTHTISLQDIARHFGYTKQHIIQVFKRNYFTTPTSFLIEKRLELAKMLLAETTLPIHEIAPRCGYEDPNYFSRLFREKYALSPQQYRSEL